MRKFYTLLFLSLILALGINTNGHSQVVISKVYGGGGNSGATYTNDFIELFNRSTNAVDVTGWSVQYAGATGTSWQVTLLSGTIQPGQYYLVQEGQGSGGTTPLPAPDATGTIAMSATAGKVALVNNTTALAGVCPTTVIDFVGFGTTANCYEGTGPTPAPSNTNAVLRALNGCTDTDVNSSDFSTGAPNPRNSASPFNPCVVGNSISVAAGTDAAEPATNGSFVINFSATTTTSTDVNFAYTGSAIFGTDYSVTYSAGSTVSTIATGTLTVPAGIASVTVTIVPVNDALVEGDETITLGLSSPTGGYSIGSASADITITDDDISTVSVGAGSDAAEPSVNGSFIITLSDPAPTGGVIIAYSLSGSATLNTDYSDPQNGSITIPAGSTTGTIILNTINDADYEGTETINILLTSASNSFVITTSTASINLLDDEAPPAIVINEVYGGGGNSGADYKNDFIELYNPGTTAVNLNGWSVQYASATGISWQVTPLSGTIQPNGYYLIQEAAGSGGTTDLPTPDAIGSIAMSGTNGKVALVSNITALTVCPSGGGIVDKVGYGTATCFEGAGAAPGLSNTTSDQRSPAGFDSDNNNTDFVAGVPTPKNSVVDLTPPTIVSLSPSDDATGTLTSFIATISFSENIQKGTGTIVLKKVSDGSIVSSLDVSTDAVSVSGSNVSFDINSLAFNTDYYFEITAGAFIDANNNPFGGISGSADWNFSTSATPPAGLLGTTYDFNTCTGSLTNGFTQFNVLGAQIWGCTAFGRDPAEPSGTTAYPNAIQMNGYANGIDHTNEDWLISPAFDLTGTNYPLLSFWSRAAFAGATLQLKVSTDYTGTGDPYLATWTDINGKFPSEVSDVWKLSENINLSAYKSSNTFFAFVYTSTTEDGARWTLDDLTVINSSTPPPPSLTISTTDIQYTFVANGSTADKTFTITGNDLTGDVTVTSTSAFLLSKDGSSFSSSLTYTQAEANDNPETVYVRFSPSAANQSFAGTITISTAGTASETINVKGSSIDPATTLEVVNWNMEWFGSPTLGPTNDDLQQQNASTVLNTIGADIYGLVEVVDEARLQNVVNSLNTTYGSGTYSYIICNYGSHVNPPEPAGSPLSEVQKEAFVFKTELFSNISTRPLIFNEDVNSSSYYNWSSGRYPFLMTADVTLNCVTKTINFVLIHAKANTAPTATSYARRQAAANELHDTLTTYFANENVIILGDFNDDLDQSITTGFTTTSYSAFTTDPADFFSPTLALSMVGKKSTVSYNDVIDHVIISEELEPYYLPESATILTDVASLINKYGTTTTDHYPVFTRYIFPNTITPAITTCTAAVTFCSNTSNSYTIPAFVATDDCGDVVSYSYTISGATERNGSSNDASGTFNTGTSLITWTATDSWGNSTNCQTTVTVNTSPAVSVPDAYVLTSGVLPNTVYIGYAPASTISLSAIASGGTGGYSYNWSTGSASSSITVSPVATVTYTVTVTDANSCQATANKTVNLIDIRGGKKMDKVTVCHNSNNTLVISGNAVSAHLAHGDMLGNCINPSSIITQRSSTIEPAITENFSVLVLPNPSTHQFVLSIKTKDAEVINFKVIDINGRVIEQKSNINANQLLKVGESYRPGIYIAEISTGNERKSVKLVKL